MFRICSNSRKRRQSGSALIEVSMFMPMLMIMCLGTADFARVFYAGIGMASVARAGAQYGSLSPGHATNATGIQTAALADAANQGYANGAVTINSSVFCTCTGANQTAQVTCSGNTACGGVTPSGYVSVTANYSFNTLVNWRLIPRTTNISRRAVLRVQ